jgi:nucleoside-diphosphate-sugar epimerase
MNNNNYQTRRIFIAGGSGYIGRGLIPALLEHNHSVTCLVRKESINKLHEASKPIIGNVLDNNSYKEKIYPADTFIHLVGVSHPNPSKGEQFRKIDLLSLKQSVEASVESGIKHFIYMSVAHPAPLMKEYILVREECEEIINNSGLNTTIIRPWYVLGPGHRWPYVLIPVYKLFERIPSTSESAKRLGLVTIKQIVQTLIYAIENPVFDGKRIIEVPEIKNYPSYKSVSAAY